MTRSRMSARPDSMPRGTASARHILMPLYWAGLWLAVNIAPGTPRCPDAKYSWSVDASPIIVTSAPAAAAPSANARAMPGDDGRMSCPTTTPLACASVTATKADPTARARLSSIWSGTVPRTSYALKTAESAAAEVPGMPVTLSAARGRQAAGRSGVRRAEHPQVSAPTDLTTGFRRQSERRRVLRSRRRPGGLAHRIGARPQVAVGRAARVEGRRQPQHLPPAWRTQPFAVRFAQVVGVRLGIGGQRPQDRGLVRVDVGQRGDRRPPAGGSRATAGRTHGADGTGWVR